MTFADFAGRLGSIMQSIGFTDLVDIAIIAYIVYQVLILLKKTRAFQIRTGLSLFFAVYVVAITFNLKTVTFLIDNLLQVGFIALLIIFQPELRRALEQVISGMSLSLSAFRKKTLEEIEVDRLRRAIIAICDGIERMSEKKTGALIVMENFTRLENIKRTGTVINSDITPELIGTIFYDGSPLHDGAVIVHDGRITHAACVLPLSDNLEISKDMGTRHRAALGISEVSDVIALVVSEETGTISFAKNGILSRDKDRQSIYELLDKEFVQPLLAAQDKSAYKFLRRKDDE